MATLPFKCESIVPVASLYGNRIDTVTYRRGRRASGEPRRCIRCQDFDEPPGDDPDELTTPDARVKALEAIFNRCGASGQFTAAQLRTLNALWIEHESIRCIARREGVSPQAILARIEGKRLPDGRFWGVF